MKHYVIVVAGGKGLRMGSDLPKQFIPIGGQPALMHTLRKFAQAMAGIRILLVLPKSHQLHWKELCETYSFEIEHTVIDGGDTRFHSVSNGLKAVPKDKEVLVAVHDGVRPLVDKRVITEGFEKAETLKAVIPVISINETIRELLPDGGSQTVPRDNYRLVQTPQIFQASLLHEAYGQPYHVDFTDDASVVEALGFPVSLVEGNRENIKLTTPIDLKLAEILIHAEYKTDH